VYVFFAFFNAGYKPNARSHNIAQEDIDHFLKWGSMLHGEWFEGGKRLPGGPTGEARLPLPSTLSIILSRLLPCRRVDIWSLKCKENGRLDPQILKIFPLRAQPWWARSGRDRVSFHTCSNFWCTYWERGCPLLVGGLSHRRG
jgi:hypothetical protein